MLTRHNVNGVTDVALLYENFVPTKEAVITLARPNYMQDSLRELKNGTLSGKVITSEALDFSETGPPQPRFGYGPNASMDNIGKNVVLSYFPPKTGISQAYEPILEKYELAGPFKDSVILTDYSPQNPISLILKCKTESEAYRVVRDLHLKNPLGGLRWTQILLARVLH